MRDDNEMKKFRLPSRLRAMVQTASIVVTVAVCCMASAQRLPTATAPGSYISVGGTYGYFDVKYPGSVNVGGIGVYVDMNIRRQIGIEAEGRWLRQGELFGSNESTYLIGPRVQIHRGAFSPYVKALIGDGKLVFEKGYYGNYFVVAGGAGLDVDLTSKIKLRLIDFEYQDWPQFNFGVGDFAYPLRPYGVSAGLSYTVYNPGGWRKHRYK